MKYYNNTKKYFVNLDEKTDRLELIRSQVGNDFIRWSACLGKNLTLFQISDLFNLKYSFKKYKCYLTTGEMACTLSHYAIYKQIAQDSSIQDHEYVLISEDDNLFISDFKTKLDQLINYLYQDKFSNNELVILRYNSIKPKDTINFGKILSFMHSNIINPKDKKKLLESGFRENELKRFDKYYIRETIRVHKSCVYSFNYQGLDSQNYQDSINSHPLEQSLIAVHKFLPRSSACYLIRKSTCKRIITQNPRPWWITDDFKAIISVPNILIASPLLAYDSDHAIISSIYNYGTIVNYDSSKIVRFRDKFIFKALKHFPFILTWNYSSSSIKRNISTIIQKLLFISRS